MKTEEMIRPDWMEFCRRLQEQCRGAMVSIELVRLDGRRDMVVHDMPLQSVGMESECEGCNTNFVLKTGLPDQKPVRHVVVDPTEAILHRTEAGDRSHRIEIFGENGTTIAIFHPGLTPEVWQGFEARRAW